MPAVLARKDMEDHMTANQQKHILQGYQEFKHMKLSIRREIESLEESIQCNTNTPESTAQSLRCMKSILQSSLDKIGDTLTFRVTNFPQLRENVWQSPSFSIGNQVRVCLALYPRGVGRGEGSHVSVSLILTGVEKDEEDMYLGYNVSVAAVGQHMPTTRIQQYRPATFICGPYVDTFRGQHATQYADIFRSQHRSAMPIGQHLSGTQKTLELCTYRGRNVLRHQQPCSAQFIFPSPGKVLKLEEMFLEMKEAYSLLKNDTMILELTLLEHLCYRSEDSVPYDFNNY